MKPANESEIKSNPRIMKKKIPPKYTIKRKRKDVTTIKVVRAKSDLQNLTTIINVYAPHSGLTRDSPQ